jgi:hypothetical protein
MPVFSSVYILLILYFVVYLIVKDQYCAQFYQLRQCAFIQRGISNHRRPKACTCRIKPATFNSHNILWYKLINILILTYSPHIPEWKMNCRYRLFCNSNKNNTVFIFYCILKFLNILIWITLTVWLHICVITSHCKWTKKAEKCRIITTIFIPVCMTIVKSLAYVCVCVCIFCVWFIACSIAWAILHAFFSQLQSVYIFLTYNIGINLPYLNFLMISR